MTWLDSSDDVLAFARGDLVCVVNLGDEPAALPAHTDVLLTSAPLEAGLLPRDTAAWLRTARLTRTNPTAAPDRDLAPRPARSLTKE